MNSLSITPATVNLPVGQSRQFTATGSYSNGTTSDLSSTVSWSVSNSSVLYINASGLATATALGTAVVSAVAPTDSISASATVTSSSYSYEGMLTYHNDLSRDGQNLNETILTPSNVNSAQFGKLFSYPVDIGIYAQPLYVESVNIANQGLHNVIYVATAHGSVYAFDADGKTSQPLWHVSFVNPNAGITAVPQELVGDCAFPAGEIGVIGTPVIDPSSGTLYVVAYTDENGQVIYRLHALDITSGAEKLDGPVEIQATVPGIGAETNGQGQVPFDPRTHLQRPGLALVSGVVYIGFGSHCDTWPWHGWLFAYNAFTLKQSAVWNATPNGSSGAIWAAGGAPAADANGKIYVVTGNGTFDASSGGQDYGDSALKLDPQSLSTVDSFTPFNQAALAAGDIDLGSGGPTLLPDQPGQYPHLLVVAGKEGRIYLLNRDDLGGYATDADAGVVQELNNQINPNNLCTPSYWQSSIYLASENDSLKMFTLTNGQLSDSATAASTASFGYAGATPSISANGSSGGIVWVINTTAVGTGGGPAQLYAFDATNVSHELYDSTQAGSRDTPGTANKFAVPTVINGKVYVGTATELDVFGLLGQGTSALRRVARAK